MALSRGLAPNPDRSGVCCGISLTTVPSASRVAPLAFRNHAHDRRGCHAMHAGQSPGGAPARAALSTDAQATTGEVLYRQSCSGCHGATLTGEPAPPLTGPGFETSWSDPRVTLADAFFIARTTMPPRASNTLTAQDHAAVFAYILRMNGFPAGTTRDRYVAAAGIGAHRDCEIRRRDRRRRSSFRAPPPRRQRRVDRRPCRR